MSVYDYSVELVSGDVLSLNEHKNEVLLLVNVASKCGFTPQYEGLEALHQKYHDKGLTIVGLPCNQFGEQAPGSAEEEASFCKVNFGVTFPITKKIDVNGENADPLYQYLSSVTQFEGFQTKKDLQEVLTSKFGVDFSDSSIKWNFTKFLVDRQGNVVRYEPDVAPEELVTAIENLL